MDKMLEFQLTLPGNIEPVNILPLFGGAAKPLEEMTAVEREQAAEQIYAKAREAAFSRGLPVIISKNGQTVREYADGRTEPVK
ncbi:MAG: hypothetical protein LH609_22015 [Rudanella sp.]|nr:hypothetical protein [Rudanella sp.]